MLEAIASRLEAIALRLGAIASRLEAIALGLEAISIRLEAIVSRLEAIATRLEAIASRCLARVEAMKVLKAARHPFIVRLLCAFSCFDQRQREDAGGLHNNSILRTLLLQTFRYYCLDIFRPLESFRVFSFHPFPPVFPCLFVSVMG